MKLLRDFFGLRVDIIASDLLGKKIVRILPNRLKIGVIVIWWIFIVKYFSEV